MKSRTSFFNATAFRKNLTRFAPAWALYGVLLLMILLTLTGLDPDGLDSELVYMLPLFTIANFLFALLAAQLLFGDLYNSRMCNALHALPMRREGWFATNLASGMTFSLIPTLAALVFCLLVTGLMGCEYENGMIVPLLVFLGANLQYLFFFGLAVLSAFLVGSRFAMAVVYGILNFGSLIVYWLVDTLYTPMLYGLKTVFEPFMLFSPVVQMLDFEYIGIDWVTATPENAVFVDRGKTIELGTAYMSGGWGYLAVCAILGIAMMGLALLLYRKRKLECAGDFMAVKGMEPVFLVVYTLFAGALFQLFFGLFNGNDIDIFLFIGLVIGFFTGRMLLKRTVRVFQWKAWAMCGGLIAVFVLTLLVTFLDPFGIQRWVPKAEEVKSVTVYANHSSYASNGEYFTVDDPEDIEKMIQVHALALTGEENLESDAVSTEMIFIGGTYTPSDTYYTFPLTLSYRMKNGTTVRRYYYIWTRGEAGQILEDYFSAVECVLGAPEEELEALAERIECAYIDGAEITADYLGLLEAMAKDCKDGKMIQIWAYRRSGSDTETTFYIEFNYHSNGIYTWNHIRISTDCTNTIQWLEEHNISTPNYGEKYGY